MIGRLFCKKQIFENLFQKIISNCRFSFRFKIIIILPTIIWLCLFEFSKYIPYKNRPEIDIKSLPTIESFFLFGGSLQHFPRNKIPETEQWKDLLAFMDMLAAFAYFIHFIVTWLFVIFLYMYYRKKKISPGKPVCEPYTYLWCFGLLNIFAVSTQLIWPTAPPWYIELYGFKPASYSISGDPAGLSKADNILQYPFFKNIYEQSPVVFGSFPSLHAAWPILITIFTPSITALKILGWIYIIIVWWAAVYLNHHYVLDLIGGSIYVIFSYYFGKATIRLIKFILKNHLYSGEFNFNKLSGTETNEETDYEMDNISDPEDFSKNNKRRNKITEKEDIVPLLIVQEV